MFVTEHIIGYEHACLIPPLPSPCPLNNAISAWKGANIMNTSSQQTWLSRVKQYGQQLLQHLLRKDVSLQRPALHHLAQEPDRLPLFIRESAVAMRYLRLLGSLDWDQFPERDLERKWTLPAIPYAPFVAACLVKLDQQIQYMARLRQYLVEHPALTWILGFPLSPSSTYSWGFDVDASLPTHRHLTRMLRTMPNAPLQVLLDSIVSLLQTELPPDAPFGHTISLDTKHILAWVKENNPKVFIEHDRRYDKAQQPTGDPDCRLGCKRKRNQQTETSAPPPTPIENPMSAATLKVGTWYWGYATGVVATKVPGWGEFVLAELTQSFDNSDVSYFFPLMDSTTKRLGVRPSYGAFDAAFDAWYVYEYFYAEDRDGFAAVPRVERGPTSSRTFNAEGLPLCDAGLAMPLKATFWAKTSLVPHEKGRYVCPFQYPEHANDTCPISHTKWASGGCVTTIPTSIGARLRHQLDRDSAAYKQVYNQRTATERINAQAVELGIERPKIRNGQAIANHNTLIYLLINLRALQRIRSKKMTQPVTIPSGRSHP
jgi:hypothetical protein